MKTKARLFQTLGTPRLNSFGRIQWGESGDCQFANSPDLKLQDETRDDGERGSQVLMLGLAQLKQNRQCTH
jgi:hypothetical protein